MKNWILPKRALDYNPCEPAFNCSEHIESKGIGARADNLRSDDGVFRLDVMQEKLWKIRS